MTSPRTSPRLTRRRIQQSVAALGSATALLCLLAGSAVATPAPAKPTAATATPARLTFGADLDWRSDNAEDYAKRLGGTPGIYGETLAYPLRTVDENDLETAARAAAAQGADVLIHLIPSKPLAALTSGDASTLADQLSELSTRVRVGFEVDFAPDMNASWTAWGQQPAAFVTAYRTVATAVHQHAAKSSMVWAPANGAGYPYDSAKGDVTPSGPRPLMQLDTNGDGKVNSQDEPYRPYWPGAGYVDRVALPVYWYGPGPVLGVNSLPTAGWLSRSVQGLVGYATSTGPDRDFVREYADAQHKPMLLETSAVYVPSQASGPTHAAIDAAWIHQVLDPTLRTKFPSIDSVVWLERRLRDAEARGALVDWWATDNVATAAVLRRALIADGVALGPVPKTSGSTQADQSVSQLYSPLGSGAGLDAGGDRILVGLAVLLGLLLLAGLVGRVRPSWGYPNKDLRSGRDQRIDVVRGFVMMLVIFTHIEVAGPGWWFAQRLGAITGAEMFVLLSGVVLGALYPMMARRMGEFGALTASIRRAVTLYAKTLGLMLVVLFLSLLPFVDTRSITTFTDLGTGAGGAAAAGRVYDLLGTARHLIDYPPPEYAIRDFVLLRWGPWPMNIMGLFVILSLAVPALMWLVRHRLWWLMLAISWALYVVNWIHHVTFVNAQFEAVFPLLSWQVAFTHGLVLGRYRVEIYRFLTGRVGKAIMAGVPAVLITLLLLLRFGVNLPLLPDYADIYNKFYQRTYLLPGRLLDLPIFLFCVYALLTTCWTPLNRVVGRFLEPLGRQSLRVFFIQVFLVLGAGVLPGLDRSSAWQGGLVDAAALVIAWLCVRDWKRPKASAPPAGPSASDQRPLRREAANAR